jgi:hypothetical protein
MTANELMQVTGTGFNLVGNAKKNRSVARSQS